MKELERKLERVVADLRAGIPTMLREPQHYAVLLTTTPTTLSRKSYSIYDRRYRKKTSQENLAEAALGEIWLITDIYAWWHTGLYLHPGPDSPGMGEKTTRNIPLEGVAWEFLTLLVNREQRILREGAEAGVVSNYG